MVVQPHERTGETTPGFHPNFNRGNFAEDEQNILHKLSREWYLTNSGKEVRLLKAKYHYFLMKPTRLISEMFNIEREVLCLFSSYRNFEPRTLDAFHEAMTELQKLRLEAVCRVLISRDRDIEYKINDLIKSDPEQPIVIPFSYDELLSKYDDYFVRNRFRNHFYTRDLFAFQSPLKKDLYFFGRTELIQDIVNRHRSGENSGLFGLRKSGKTSIVYAIERFTATHGELTLAIDCENPSVHVHRWYELLYEIVRITKEQYCLMVKTTPQQRYTEKAAASYFEKDMLVIHQQLGKRMLLIFDEIERLSPKTGASDHWRTGDDFLYFWQTLRYFFQRHPDVLTYLLVGTNPQCVETPTFSGQDNPLFGSIPFQYVPSFDVRKTREMVRKLGTYMGLKFNEMIYSKLTEDFGGHPFLIRQMCSLINTMTTGRQRPIIVDKVIYERAKAEFIRDSSQYIDMVIQVLRDWHPVEYDMLVMLATNEEQMVTQLAREGDFTTHHLLGYGLLSSDTSGYAFNIECVKDYLIARHKYERKGLSPEEQWAEVSERRNALEKKLRQVIRNQLKATVGRKAASAKALGAIPEERRKTMLVSDIDFVLDPDKSPLFLLDLIHILTIEWDIFKNIFESLDKNRLAIMLEDINKYRNDAHAKAFQEDDFLQLRLHFKRLDDILAAW